MMDIHKVYEIFHRKYPQLKTVPLTFIDTKMSEIEGKCVYDIEGNYINNGKSRTSKIIPREIVIYNTGDTILTLLHEIAHALTVHYERKVKDEYVYIEHSHLFYETYLEISEYAYEKNIINKKLDIKKLKFVDKNS